LIAAPPFTFKEEKMRDKIKATWFLAIVLVCALGLSSFVV
jgi:hypothetical protein|tara:strand:+ start:6615 stop:6734 length:120 start_codon:yes stop_codon:yes gene_type:complete